MSCYVMAWRGFCVVGCLLLLVSAEDNGDYYSAAGECRG